MKRVISLALVLLLLAGCADSTTNEPKESYEDKSIDIGSDVLSLKELGVPLSDYYENQTNSRNVWDIIVYQDRLFIGCGDANANTGPCPVFSYDLAADDEQNWEQTGIVADEKIAKFVILNDELIIPGADPQYGVYGWQQGTFHLFQNEEWITVDTIPNGVHNFDMVEHNGMLYAGLAVEYQGSPIVRSSDGGQTWEQISLVRDGQALIYEENSLIRVHSFLKLNGDLYAYFLNSNSTNGGFYSLYKYQDDAFYYCETNWANALHSSHGVEGRILANAEFNGKLFIAAETLYSTDDIQKIQAIQFPVSLGAVYDLIVKDDILYVLVNAKVNDGLYETRVYASQTGENGSFFEEVSFQYELPVHCFAIHETTFYFGTFAEYEYRSTNNTTQKVAVENSKVGMILSAPKGLKIEEDVSTSSI